MGGDQDMGVSEGVGGDGSVTQRLPQSSTPKGHRRGGNVGVEA